MAKDPEGEAAPALSIKELTDFVGFEIDEIIDLEAQRKAINSNLTKKRSAVIAKGINKRALGHAIAYRKMDEDNRDGYDRSYVICRDAIKLPLQSELFAGAKPAEDTVPTTGANGTAKKKAAKKKPPEKKAKKSAGEDLTAAPSTFLKAPPTAH